MPKALSTPSDSRHDPFWQIQSDTGIGRTSMRQNRNQAWPLNTISFSMDESKLEYPILRLRRKEFGNLAMVVSIDMLMQPGRRTIVIVPSPNSIP
ncbi:MAG: hypothetical protein GEU26_17370 [Nitrososphaeraceae archaeon]|nr:hypothetical protein [Nitrososphaeraceae archaeon]